MSILCVLSDLHMLVMHKNQQILFIRPRGHCQLMPIKQLLPASDEIL